MSQEKTTKGLILLTELRFPQHGQVQEWLNATEYGEQFDLCIASAVIYDNWGREMSRTIPALQPKTKELEFLWILKGEPGARELEQMIFDFQHR